MILDAAPVGVESVDSKLARTMAAIRATAKFDAVLYRF